MKEFAEFRMPEDKAVQYLPVGVGVKLSGWVRKITVPVQDPLVNQIVTLHHNLIKEGDYLYLYSNILRQYSMHEIVAAKALRMVIRHTFEPAGEKCGTAYSEVAACKYCGAGGEQVSELILDPRSLPHPNRLSIATTIAGEIVVSGAFQHCVHHNSLAGAEFRDVRNLKRPQDKIPGWHQLKISSQPLNIMAPTHAGSTPFCDEIGKPHPAYSIEEMGGPGTWCDRHSQYVCPVGHTIGLNLFSELTVKKQVEGAVWDLAITKQLIGVRRGLLRPNPLFVVSDRFVECSAKWGLKGISFEVVHLV